MLKEGKITVEQASDLLEAVGKDKAKNNEESFIDKGTMGVVIFLSK